MKRLSVLLLLLVASAAAYALEVPPLRGRVNDYAGILSPGMKQRLESQLADFEKSDSTQIVVLTVPGLKGEVLEAYSIKVAESWKIGHKGKDNGAILLIARDDRKLRIEVGRGLEGRLTDLMAGRIIRNEITPRFKAGDYDGGVNAGVSAMIALVRGEYKASPIPYSGKTPFHENLGIIIMLGIILLILLSTLGAFSRIAGGLISGIGIPGIGYFCFSHIPVAGLAGLAAGGFILGFFISWLIRKTMEKSGGGGGSSSNWGSSGGGYSSSNSYSSGGSSSSSGGFSGGGGSFGGGGSSGSW